MLGRWHSRKLNEAFTLCERALDTSELNPVIGIAADA